MTDKSGGSEQILSLPKGGGAIKGIGETFQPNLFSGTGNFSIPIFTSPGRGGFGPQLTLQYSTGNGNGSFGLGWNLSIPRITRKTEKGLPKYTDEDVFVMSGAEDLVVSDNQIDEVDPDAEYQITRYCPRTEGLFARIEKWVHRNDATSIHWRATTKENITSIYGRTPAARIVDPKNNGRIYEWLLEETFDAKGNHILYEYAGDKTGLSPGKIYETNRTYCQHYIRRIYYGNLPKDSDGETLLYDNGHNRKGLDHTDGITVINRNYAFEVVFDYKDWDIYAEHPDKGPDRPQELFGNEIPMRDDPFSSFRSGFEIRILRRCERVLMFHHFKELGCPTLVKSTDFTYKNDPQTRLSILSSATIRGYQKAESDDSYTSSSMPSVTFKYSQFTPYEQKYQSVTARGDDMPPVSLKDPQTTLVDLFGDGLPDVLNTTATGYYFWRNLGNGQLDMRHPQHTVPAGITLSQPGVAFGDMGGDGMADLIVQWPEMAGFYEATPDGSWKPFKKFDTYPSFSLTDPNARLIDLTGDGRSDILMTRDRHFLWFKCLGEAGYAKPRAVMREHNLDEFPDVYFSDPSGRVRLADMTGDGLNDIILLHNGRVDYWPNLGYGRFGKRITMTQSPRLEYNFDPKRLFLADLDGSGCADLVYVDTGKVHFWFNQSGNGWSEEQVINGTPPVTDFDSVQFSDIFGTGTATLVWSYDYGRYPGENYKALDLCGGKKPYVLSEMSNNMGATTRVQYAPSTRFYLEDKENGMPWVTNLPFPVHVVEKVEAIDHISKTKLVTTYKYHHGYYDGREREFRGFGRVDQFDTETVDDFTSPGLHGDDQLFTNNDQAFHVPPVETRSWFHTGVYFNEDKLGKDGKPFDHHKLMEAYKQEFYAKDAKAFPMEDQLFKSHTSRDDMEAPHEIFRALRGAMLRTEVYARDGSEKEPHPYVVTQNRYLITKIQPKGENRHAVYLTTPKESLSYHYERNPDDPRVGHDITLAVDVFGNVTDKISIGYPRRVPNDLTEQGELKILYSKADFINKTDASDFYYIGVPYQSLAFEVTGYEWDWETSQKFPATDFDDIMVNTAHPLEKWNVQPYEWKRPDGHAGVEKRLVEWTRSYFKNEGNNEEYLEIINPPGSVEHRLDLGKITRLGLPYETYQAVFTSIDSLKKQLEDGKDTDENRFRIKFGIDSDLLIEGGYHQDQDVAGYWWIPSGRQNFNKDNFYLPEKAQDPFGNLSTIEHDRYGLLMTKAVDPLGNTIEAKNNYRVLQPYAVTDPNQNFSVVRFDELGFVVKTALRGQNPDETWEGDYLNPEESEIQTDDDPTTRLEYDLFQWSGSNRPNYVKTLARERHQDDTTPWQESFLYSDGFGREVQTKVQAEPGKVHGMHCDKRWVGTGRKIYNNKGKPVKQYEPFFSSTHEYEDEALVVETGVTPVLFYDPLERVICTVHPNHTYKKVVFDPWKQETWDVNDTVYPLEKFDTVHFDPANPVYPDHVFNPADDTDIGNYISALPPKDYLPTWYDLRMDASKALEKWPDTERNEEKERNERIRISEKSAAQKAAKHCATPTITHLDSLGRPFLTIANNGFKSDGTDHLIKTRVKLDIEGNDLTITDPRNIIAFQHQFDIAGRTIFVNSVDAGRSAMVTDISGNPIRTQDANGNWMSITYDELRRPTETIVHRTRPYNDTITSQVMIYGETLNEETAIKNNQRGQLYAIFDGAGAVFNLSYDFKGNLEQSIRRLTITYKADEIDWKDISDIDFAKPLFELESKLEPLLAKETFFTSTSYDALNRVTESTTPDHSLFNPGDVEPPDGSKYTYGYNEANLLEKVTVNLKKEDDDSRADQVFVSNINYNARGQREKIVYGNGVETTYTYDPYTFRLVHLGTTRKRGAPTTLQSLHHTYDPAGNITEIRNDAIETIWYNQTKIEPVCKYAYDPVYRLAFAEGREHKSMITANSCQDANGFKNSMFLEGPPHPNDSNALQMFNEEYAYDLSGNITEIKHKRISGPQSGTIWTRTQTYHDDSNRIKTSQTTDRSAGNGQFGHDRNGNFLSLQPNYIPNDPDAANKQRMKWDYKNQLVEVQTNEGSNPNRAYYQYDAARQRVRETVVKGSTVEERIYLGGYEIYTKKNGSGTPLRCDTLHVMDDKDRIALIEKEVDLGDGKITNIRFRYQLSNHLRSSVMEVDETDSANLISYEEYYPYGGTSYIAGISEAEVSRKRYRYSGKERDDETGLYYYGARYYVPWMGLWCNCDPAGMIDGTNIYIFSKNSPIVMIDPSGWQSASSQDFELTSSFDNLQTNSTYHTKPNLSYTSTVSDYLNNPLYDLGTKCRSFDLHPRPTLFDYLLNKSMLKQKIEAKVETKDKILKDVTRRKTYSKKRIKPETKKEHIDRNKALDKATGKLLTYYVKELGTYYTLDYKKIGTWASENWPATSMAVGLSTAVGVAYASEGDWTHLMTLQSLFTGSIKDVKIPSRTPIIAPEGVKTSITFNKFKSFKYKKYDAVGLDVDIQSSPIENPNLKIGLSFSPGYHYKKNEFEYYFGAYLKTKW